MRANRILTAILAVGLLVGCGDNSTTIDYDTTLINNPNTANRDVKEVKMPKMSFDKNLHDFGRLSQGESIAYSFKFSNTGNADLLISECDATCGCTVADYPRSPIKPGEVGYITVTFNSAGKHGQEEQFVMVMANTQPSKNQLIIRANVEN